jgi:Undecaprenyl-phosphate glucose phosphotransferase
MPDSRKLNIFDTPFVENESRLAKKAVPDAAADLKSRSAIHRISLEQRVVAFCLIELMFVAFFGLGISVDSAPSLTLPSDTVEQRWIIVTFALGLFLLVSRTASAYRSRRILDQHYSPQRLALAMAITFLILIVIGAATKTSQSYSRFWFFSWAAFSCIGTPLARLAGIAFTRWQLAKGAFVYRALTVSLFCEPLKPEDILRKSDGQVMTVQSLRLENIQELENLSHIIGREEIDQIYIVVPWVDTPGILQELQQFRQFAAEIFVLPDDRRVHTHQLGVGTIGERLSLQVVDRPINGWDLWLKRMEDIIVAGTIILFLLPVIALIALAIRLDSPGPIFFKQKREGFNGGVFELWKFRSMYHDKSDAGAMRQTSRNDDRVTRVGRFIRRTSLDELPQFFNVLQGGMSVVGPRPHALKTQALGHELKDVAEQYATRHRVKPGLTGWAQVNGCRGELDSFEKVQKRVDYDIDYIDNWSLWFDVKIVLLTALLVVYDQAAY